MGEDITASRKQAIYICQQMLDGKIGILGASRQLRDFAFKAFSSHKMPKELEPFRGFDSEAGGIPLGPERRHWSEEALRRKELEISALEEKHHDLAFKCGRELLAFLR